MNTKKYKVLIIGLGNLIMSDDGVGSYLIRELKKIKDIPIKDVSLLELGTSPLYYLEEISRAESLIVIDAVKGGEKPGSIYCFKSENLKTYSISNRDFHGYSIIQVIDLARELTKLPTNITVYGMEPGNTGPGEGLSDSLKNALPKLVELIIEEIWKQN